MSTDTPFAFDLAHAPKPDLLVPGPTGEGTSARGLDDAPRALGQDPGAPLRFEPALQSDAYNFGRWAGHTEVATDVVERLTAHAAAAARASGTRPHDPRDGHAGTRMQQELEAALAAREVLVERQRQQRDVVYKTRQAVASMGTRPTRPSGGLAGALGTAAVALPTAPVVTLLLVQEFGVALEVAAPVATVGSLLVASGIVTAVISGALVDMGEARPTWLTWGVSAALPGVALALVWVGLGGAPLVGAGLGLLAAVAGAVLVQLARGLHRTWRAWTERIRPWEAADAAVQAAVARLDAETADLETAQARIDDIDRQIARMADASRASESRAELASEAAALGYLRGVNANRGDVDGWRRRPRSKAEQTAQWHRLHRS